MKCNMLSKSMKILPNYKIDKKQKMNIRVNGVSQSNQRPSTLRQNFHNFSTSGRSSVKHESRRIIDSFKNNTRIKKDMRKHISVGIENLDVIQS